MSNRIVIIINFFIGNVMWKSKKKYSYVVHKFHFSNESNEPVHATRAAAQYACRVDDDNSVFIFKLLMNIGRSENIKYNVLKVRTVCCGPSQGILKKVPTLILSEIRIFCNKRTV